MKDTAIAILANVRLPSEAELQAKLLLEAPKHLSNVRLFRRNIGAVQTGERWTRFGIPGMADVQVVLKGGRIIECEIKALGGSLRPEQKAWQTFCENWEIPWLLLKPLKNEDAETTVTRWIGEIAALCGSSG